jgi:threonine synthase
MWRYASVLPDVTPVTLGEGWTPMLQSKRYPGLFIKEEGANPTGTFKARGLGLAVTMAKHYGLKHLAVPSAGNAAGALAAYAAAAGIAAHIFMPQDVPFANYLEGIVYGADVTWSTASSPTAPAWSPNRSNPKSDANTPAEEVWFDISTLKEPFRVEGKKTMGYELVEQLGWTYPDAVFYPTGGGVGLIGMWKAFEEMEQLGWVTGKQAPQDVRPAGLRLRSRRPRLRRRQARQRVLPERRHLRRRPSRPQALRRLHHPRHRPRIRRQGPRLRPTNRSSPASSTTPNNEGIFLSPEGAAATAAYDHSSPPANSPPPTASSSSTPAPASSTPT